MLISYKSYKWVNPETGKEPVLGDEFLYVFFAHKDEPQKVYLCMKPAIHPIKKHPMGLLGILAFVIAVALGENENQILSDTAIISGIIGLLFLITGSIFSFISYTSYYLKERQWKQKVIIDWKSDLLRFKHHESTLSDFKFKKGGAPIDEKVFF